ncbi:pyrimidodiazepine synthase-like [Achroia grisella]|uniref:pyrimidodiazepine synthase-like n=1 Tax=Achroia grisella TaxID=688607 RepID=UPI0027D2A638|nr:pyrimidodiazepine synthase-like [Achroia grisella]
MTAHFSRIYQYLLCCYLSDSYIFRLYISSPTILKMITSTFSLAIHVFMTSSRILRPVARLLGYTSHLTMATKAVKGKINFNTKHLTKGDPLPPFNGKLRVYNMRYCPYAQRTILALNAKQIDYEVVNINLVNKPEWYTTKSAFGKVPAIEIEDGVTIYESLVTVEYLDDVYPQRPLLPKDPVKKAFDKIIIEAAGPISTLFYKLLRSPESITEDNFTAYHQGLDFIQEQLKKRGTKFLDGDQPGFVDYMIWPWFERILQLDLDERIKIKEDKYKLLVPYLNDMLKDPAVSQYLVPDEILQQFLKAYTSGDLSTVNYNLLTQD